MVGPIDLIKATIEDAPLVAHLHVSGWRDGYAGLLPQPYLDSLNISERAARWTKNIADGSTVWIAKYDGEPASIISYGPPLNPIPDGMAECGEITILYTLGQFYRRGIGETLFRHARASLAADGFKSLYLWVLEENMKGRFFYQKMAGTLISDASQTTTISGQDFKEIAYGWQL